jgi:hypothetical protein
MAVRVKPLTPDLIETRVWSAFAKPRTRSVNDFISSRDSPLRDESLERVEPF